MSLLQSARDNSRIPLGKLIQKVEAENNIKNEPVIEQLRQLVILLKSNSWYIGGLIIVTTLCTGAIIFIFYGPDGSFRSSLSSGFSFLSLSLSFTLFFFLLYNLVEIKI